MSFAQRVTLLKPEGAYQVLARAQALEAEGRNVLHLEIGEPDFATAPNIGMAGIGAIVEGSTRYTPPAGLTALREAIAEEASRQRGISFHPSQVVVSPGAKPNLFFPALALINPGDEIIYPDPGFLSYSAIIGIAGGVPVPVPLVEENSFSFDLDVFDKVVNERIKLIILDSPSNPTGGVMPRQDLEHVAVAVQRYNSCVLSDEIYARIAFDGVAVPSISTLPGMMERTIIVDGFSKTYAMTGWRLGFGIMPESLARQVDLLLTHSVGCTAHFTQIAGMEALHGPQDVVGKMVAEYQKRRDLIIAGLNQLPGVSCLCPKGAFHAFPNIKASGKSSGELAELMLEGGVALLPGRAFGNYGEGYLRLSFATSIAIIEKALERMKQVLQTLV